MLPNHSTVIRFHIFVLVSFFLLTGGEAKTFENRIVGRPFVGCRPEGVSLVAQTEEYFEGQLYVKNARTNPSCLKQYSLDQNSTQIELKIDAQQLLLCGFRMWPKPNSKKFLLSGQIIVSFHRSLVTPSDRAFSAHCEFDDFQKHIEVGISDDLIQQHPLLEGSFEAPQVEMAVLGGTDQNNPKTNSEHMLNVGDPIIFQWKLKKHSEVFGIELERCSAETNDGRGMRIIENGCSLDEELISDAQTSPDHSKIYANSLAFKFPDEHVVWIRCTVRTCIRRSDHLEIINGNEQDLCASEPSCASWTLRNRRQLRSNDSRTDIIFVNGRFQVEKHRSFEHLHSQPSESLTSSELCMPDVVYYVGLISVFLCYVITISTTVMWKWA